MDALIWVNSDRTVMVTHYDGAQVYVATRENADHIWGPPVTCNPDPSTTRFMEGDDPYVTQDLSPRHLQRLQRVWTEDRTRQWIANRTDDIGRGEM